MRCRRPSKPASRASGRCIMTALAMIIGMVPMAMGMGEGGEQNAPLGRAVIGGLLLATVATLLFVPSVFAPDSQSHEEDRREARDSRKLSTGSLLNK